MSVVLPGAALPKDTPDPVTPRGLPHRGGEVNPSVDALRAQFGSAVQRHEVTWGETCAWVDAARIREIVLWLRDDPSQQYDYLVDITAVEHRDSVAPLEMVWHLRSLPYRRFLRLVNARLQATYDDAAFPYESPDEFIADIELVAASLRANKGRNAGLFAVQRLIRRAQTFGFYIATIDVRTARPTATPTPAGPPEA